MGHGLEFGIVLLVCTLPCIFTALIEITGSGVPGIHDPSGIVEDSGVYYVLSTGYGIKVRYSTDLIHWEDGGKLLENYPEWYRVFQIPSQSFGYEIWAPDVFFFNGEYRVYYSISSFGSQQSCIGLATSDHMTGPWVDKGEVLCSFGGYDYNAIDAHVFIDPTTQKHYMVFGSFWTGIKLVELIPESGYMLDWVVTPLASHNPNSIEAAWIQYHDGFFYLYVNWWACCQGIQSTYEIRVGRSTSVKGPYLDKSGKAMLSSGGTIFLPNRVTGSNIIGPGHVGISRINDQDYLTIHYYDGNNKGVGTLAMYTLSYDENGWPVAT
jgi:arabinan endo-1,5-alpha-L-arabinosidase